MDCKQAREQLASYALGALDSSEQRAIERHLESCPDCTTIHASDGVVAIELARAVPQMEAPRHVIGQVLDRIVAEDRRVPPLAKIRGWWTAIGFPERRIANNYGIAVTAILVFAMIIGGIWFDGRLDRIAEEKEYLQAQIDSAVEDGTEMKELVKNLTSIAADPDARIGELSGTEWSSRSRGTVMGSQPGTTAVLSVRDLPSLPESQAYQVWLVKGGLAYNAGIFTVDPAGYGLILIHPLTPLHDFDGIIITIERAEGSPGPTGKSVLRGDL